MMGGGFYCRHAACGLSAAGACQAPRPQGLHATTDLLFVLKMTSSAVWICVSSYIFHSISLIAAANKHKRTKLEWRVLQVTAKKLSYKNTQKPNLVIRFFIVFFVYFNVFMYFFVIYQISKWIPGAAKTMRHIDRSDPIPRPALSAEFRGVEVRIKLKNHSRKGQEASKRFRLFADAMKRYIYLRRNVVLEITFFD